MLGGIVERGAAPDEKGTSGTRFKNACMGENVRVFVALAHVSFVMQEQQAHFRLPVLNGAP